MAEFTIQTDRKNSKVEINVTDDADFGDWMMACEFLLNKTSQLSSAGYEKAMELLCKGSMTYRTILQERN